MLAITCKIEGLNFGKGNFSTVFLLSFFCPRNVALVIIFAWDLLNLTRKCLRVSSVLINAFYQIFSQRDRFGKKTFQEKNEYLVMFQCFGAEAAPSLNALRGKLSYWERKRYPRFRRDHLPFWTNRGRFSSWDLYGRFDAFKFGAPLNPLWKILCTDQDQLCNFYKQQIARLYVPMSNDASKYF